MSQTNTPKEIDTSRIWLGGLITIILAVFSNLILVWLAKLLLTIPPEFEPLQPLRVSIFTIVGVLGGVILYAILAAKAQHAIRTYQRVAWIVLILSFLPDIGLYFSNVMPGTTATAVIILMLTHVVAGLIAIYLLPAMTRVKDA
jgi:Family of unknown function (DUF6069)